MSNLFRLCLVGGLGALAILMIGVGMARNIGALLAPIHLMLFLLIVVLYLLPALLAVYRGCEATLTIVGVNVLLGWTILGWFVAFGWAVSGKTRMLPPGTNPPPVQPLPSH